jgi:hypothetical protein
VLSQKPRRALGHQVFEGHIGLLAAVADAALFDFAAYQDCVPRGIAASLERLQQSRAVLRDRFTIATRNEAVARNPSDQRKSPLRLLNLHN